MLARLGLARRGYFLYVSRFEPENNPHRVLEAYAVAGGTHALVLVGDAPYSSALQAELRRLAAADPRVILPGAIYGDGYRELQAGAFAYVHATEVGGTHPALVEAMGYGNALVVNDTPENREVAGPEALYFRAEDPPSLAKALEILRADPERAVFDRQLCCKEGAGALFLAGGCTQLRNALPRSWRRSLPIGVDRNEMLH